MATRPPAAAATTIRASDMEKLNLEQLKALKEQIDLEVNLLQDSLNKIRTAATRLEIASSAHHDLSLRPQGKKLLVPLTASLYVAGTLDDAEKVLVDIGTGYFIEVLEIESGNVKALYRRAQANIQLADLDVAEQDIKKALEIDPNNRDVKLEYKVLKEKVKEYNKKDAKFYGNMFAKMSKVDETNKAKQEAEPLSANSAAA